MDNQFKKDVNEEADQAIRDAKLAEEKAESSASDFGDNLKDKVEHGVNVAKEKATEAANTVKEKSSEAMHSAEETAQKAKHRMQEMMD